MITTDRSWATGTYYCAELSGLSSFLLAGYAKQFNSTRCCLINLYRTELLSFPSFHLQLLPDSSKVGPTSGSASIDSKKCQCWSLSTWWKLGRTTWGDTYAIRLNLNICLRISYQDVPISIKHKHLSREVCRRNAQKATVDKIAENATEYLFWVWFCFIKTFPG